MSSATLNKNLGPVIWKWGRREVTGRYLFWPCSMKPLIVLGHVKQTYMSYPFFINATGLPLYSPKPPTPYKAADKNGKGRRAWTPKDHSTFSKEYSLLNLSWKHIFPHLLDSKSLSEAWMSFQSRFPPRMHRAHKLRVSWKEISAVEDNISWCTEGFATSLLCGCERDATLLFLSEVRLTLIILCRR